MNCYIITISKTDKYCLNLINTNKLRINNLKKGLINGHLAKLTQESFQSR